MTRQITIMYQKKSRTATLLLASRRTTLPDAGHGVRSYLSPMSGKNIRDAGPLCEMTLEKVADINPVYSKG